MTQNGWICPRCGKVNAPWMPACSCSPHDSEWRHFTNTVPVEPIQPTTQKTSDPMPKPPCTFCGETAEL